jgi:hypothetical protein
MQTLSPKRLKDYSPHLVFISIIVVLFVSTGIPTLRNIRTMVNAPNNPNTFAGVPEKNYSPHLVFLFIIGGVFIVITTEISKRK